MNEDAKLVKRVCEFADGMTPWEVQFVEDVAKSFERGVPLTPKQREVLERIDEQRVR